MVFLLSLSPPQTADANLSFDAQILEAAKSIAAATKSLVQSARATQRELTEQGKVSLGSVPADSQWSDGLVSAVSISLSYPSIYIYYSTCTCTCNCAVD